MTPDPSLSADLEQPLVAVESCLNLLGEALVRRDAAAIELQANQLHQLLAAALASFSEAARTGQLPAALRQRLMQAGGKVAAQREALARGNASLDRAIEVLIPAEPTGLYGAGGKPVRRGLGGGSYQA